MKIKEQHDNFLASLEVGNGEQELQIIKDFIDLMSSEIPITKELYDIVGTINCYINDLEHEHEVAKMNDADPAYLQEVQMMIGEARNLRRRVSNRQNISKIITEAAESSPMRNRLYDLEKKLTDALQNNQYPIYRFKSDSGVQLKYLLEQNEHAAAEYNKKLTATE